MLAYVELGPELRIASAMTLDGPDEMTAYCRHLPGVEECIALAERNHVQH